MLQVKVEGTQSEIFGFSTDIKLNGEVCKQKI